MKKKKLLIFALAALSVAAVSAVGCNTEEEHKHSYSIKSSTTQHWQECDCGDKKSVANHVDNIKNGTATKESDGKCDVCGHQMPEKDPGGQTQKYTVTFNMKGHGTAPDAQEVDEGSKAVKPATNPTATGYSFGGWFSNEDCTTPFDFNTPITENTTVYAKWTAKTPSTGDKINVIFDVLGHGTAPETQEVDEGDTATAPTAPTDDNYIFGGWYSNEECTTPFDFASAITEETTVYAKWTGKPCAVTFDMKGHGTAPTAQTVEYGKKAVKPSTDPTDDHYDFGGWYSNAECTTAFNFNSTVTGATTVYAKWDAKTFTVTFVDSDNVATMPTALSVKYGEKATRPETDPSADHHNFLGWYSDEECNNVFDFEAIIDKDTNVYAKWEPVVDEGKVTVKFNMNGVTGVTNAPSPQVIDEGNPATAPTTDPTAEHYTFGGWYKEAACTTPFDFSASVTGATTVYAKWTAKTYTLTFNANGHGTAPDALEVQYGNKPAKPDDLTADGYDFGGWYKEAACENSFNFNGNLTGNTEVYAKWTAQVYTVTFNMKGYGTAPAAQEVEYGKKVTKPEDPTATDIKFLGWCKDSACKTEFDFDEAITGTTTIYANWDTSGTLANPVKLTLGNSTTTDRNGRSKVYFSYTALGEDRFTLKIGGIFANGCTFKTNLDNYTTVYDKNGFNFDLTVNQKLIIELDCSSVSSATAKVGLELSQCMDEALPSTGWHEGTFISKTAYKVEFSRSLNEGNTKKLKFNDSLVTYTYVGGVINRVYFTSGSTKYSLKETDDGYELSSGGNTIELTAYEIIDLSKFTGVYMAASGESASAIGIRQLVIYESGGGYFEYSGGYKVTCTYGENAFYSLSFNRLTFNYGYGITVNLDDNGNTVSINVFNINDSIDAYYVFNRTGNAGKELPEKLPLSDGLELKGETLGINCQYGGQSWANGSSITIKDYDSDNDFYTVTCGSDTYTLEIEGTGEDVVVKVYDANHETLVDTLTKKVVEALDLVTDGTHMNFTAADVAGDYKSVFFKITKSGKYTFDLSDPWITLYTNISNFNVTGMNGHTFYQWDSEAKKFIVQPVTIELNANTVIAFATSDAGELPTFWISATVEEDEGGGGGGGEDPGTNGSGTQADPYVVEVGTFTLDGPEYGNQYYLTFVAPEAGTYKMHFYGGTAGSPDNFVEYTVDGTRYGYDDASWKWMGGVSYNNPWATFTFTEGQVVTIVLNGPSFCETCGIEIQKV